VSLPALKAIAEVVRLRSVQHYFVTKYVEITAFSIGGVAAARRETSIFALFQ